MSDSPAHDHGQGSIAPSSLFAGKHSALSLTLNAAMSIPRPGSTRASEESGTASDRSSSDFSDVAIDCTSGYSTTGASAEPLRLGHPFATSLFSMKHEHPAPLMVQPLALASSSSLPIPINRNASFGGVDLYAPQTPDKCLDTNGLHTMRLGRSLNDSNGGPDVAEGLEHRHLPFPSDSELPPLSSAPTALADLSPSPKSSGPALLPSAPTVTLPSDDDSVYMPVDMAVTSSNPFSYPHPDQYGSQQAASPYQAMISPVLTPSRSRESPSLSNLDLGALWQWILCVCVVNFDLELGQVLESVYPPIQFSEHEDKNISFSAFPDSNSSSHLGDSFFCFRMRSSASIETLYKLRKAPPISGIHSYATRSSADNGYLIDTDGYTYGYVHFRQQKDKEIRRGYFQKSIVILSPHPWPGLFLEILRGVGPQYMDALVAERTGQGFVVTHDISDAFSGYKAVHPIIARLCADIADWPPPPSTLLLHTSYHPTILNLVYSNQTKCFSFPPSPRFPLYFDIPKMHIVTANHPAPLQPIQATLASPARLYELFSRSLEVLWICWELMVLGEPMLVMADSPVGSSEVVAALVELIKPIPCGGDYRPYFTIQDSDFKGYINRSGVPPSATVLGVTNAVFAKALEHWPHIIRVGKLSSGFGDGSAAPNEHEPVSMKPSPSTGLALGRDAVSKKGSTMSTSPVKSIMQSLSKTRITNTRNDMIIGLRIGFSTETNVEEIRTKHRPFFGRDNQLIKNIAESAIRGKSAEVLNNMLRRHFVELTDRFLQPLNRHFESLIVGSPMHMSLSNLRGRPEIKPFQQETLLKTIEQSAPSLPIHSRRSLVEFYRQFLKSPNFAAWLQSRTSEIYREWRRCYFDILTSSDMAGWMRDRPKVNRRTECDQLVALIRKELTRYRGYFHTSSNDATFARQSLLYSSLSKRSIPSPDMLMDLPKPALDFPPLPPVAVRHHDRHDRFDPRLEATSRHRGDASAIGHSNRRPGEELSIGYGVHEMGGLVPTPQQYSALGKQLELLLSMCEAEGFA
ncbi:uncharacterized protein BJ171DRAFT_516673 [Polychytrium aggregatum]|uniref:uncharacterized protein n=1 Tax=Polychytrium aggregatum TaxID=110093 RepID=UPI0022FE4A3D|nr:uncharacterized protein BJ171DRAFT_516673 [Polychytrium aggregatum]KAI9201829.1 hypothetical protein BJ171DRAFT_516673 [Polychytrium aggregatum]